MYTGYKVNSTINKSMSSVNTRTFGSTLLNETQVESLQKEVDNYTRKLEQEKRRFITAQETYKAVLKEYEQEKEKLDKLKTDSSETTQMQTKIKNLEANLEKAINLYDETLAYNNKLKAEIDMLRREKKNFKEIHRGLEEQIKKYEQETERKAQAIEQKKKRTELLKDKILEIRKKDSTDKANTMQKFEELERKYLEEKKQRQAAKLNQKSQKTETVDTQTILKVRLKKLVAKNKEKVKVIEQYQRNIRLIEEAFEQIKEGSGITDLEEITNTFIKSQEQNYSLYNYVDVLSQNIDSLEDQNRELEKYIAKQEQENQMRRKLLAGTPEEERKRKDLKKVLKNKEKVVEELNALITAIQPDLESTLLQLAKSKFNDDPKQLYDYQLGFNVNDRNIEQYLSDLEKYINILTDLKGPRQQNTVTTTLGTEQREQTKAVNPPGYVLEDAVKESATKQDDKELLGEHELKKFAEEYIDKKKSKAKDM